MNPQESPPASRTASDRTESADAWYWPLWAVAAAFGAYFCMYMFRKPFGAATFDGTPLWSIGFKTVLVTSQVTGYMLSKFIGIKFVSEMPPRRRALAVFVLVMIAELAMIAFAVVPRPWSAICLFVQGLPLGMVFGLVLAALEGRRQTEALAAGLCASFIMAGGVAKSVGTWLLNSGVSEDWMPAAAGALFVAPAAFFCYMLWRLPPPSSRDEVARAKRSPMNGRQRGEFLRRHGLGLMPILAMFALVTVVRSIRDDFAPEIWRGLGYQTAPATFTNSETWVTLGVMLSSGLAVLIVDSRRAFFASLAICAGGLCLLLVTLFLYQAEQLAPFTFMVMMGLGLYIPYVAVHTTIFERLLAMTRDTGTIAYLMCVADALGYLGYVVVMIVRNFLAPSDNVLETFLRVSWFTGIASLACMAVAWLFFIRRNAPAIEPVIEAAR